LLKTTRATDDSGIRIWLNLEREGEEPHLGKPRNREAWEYAGQELIQAIYETAQVEAPLKLIYLKRMKDKSVQLEMNVFFSKRTVKTRMQVGSLEKTKNLRWDDLNPILKMIYAGEFLVEKAVEKEPKHPGQFINPGDGLWYEFGKAPQNPSGTNRYLAAVAACLPTIGVRHPRSSRNRCRWQLCSVGRGASQAGGAERSALSFRFSLCCSYACVDESSAPRARSQVTQDAAGTSRACSVTYPPPIAASVARPRPRRRGGSGSSRRSKRGIGGAAECCAVR